MFVLGRAEETKRREDAGAIKETHAGEFDAAVTAFRGAAALLEVLVLEFSAGGFDDADFVGAGVVPVHNRRESALAAQ